MNNTERISLCNIALESNKMYLNKEEYFQIHEYINKNNEWGLGIETLIDVLIEENKSIEKEQYNNILLAMTNMGLDQSKRVVELVKHVKNT